MLLRNPIAQGRLPLAGAFLMLGMVCSNLSAQAGVYEAPLDVKKAGDVKFVAAPNVEAAGDTVKITFEVSAATDVEVAILDGQGKVVRHLAAGLLGKNAPAPFRKNALRQELVWDRKDDLGAAVPTGGFQARVRAGSTPRLDRILGFDGNTLTDEVIGLCVGPRGEVYVLQGQRHQNRTSLRVFDKDGRYRKTLIPYSAATPPERTRSIGQIEVDGQRIPIVFNAIGGNLSPLTAGMKPQDMVFSPKGYVLLASAAASIMVHRPPRYLLAIHPDGGAPAETGFVGPQIRGLADRGIGFMGEQGETNFPWFTHLATSPDGEWVYLTESIHRPGYHMTHCVFRLKWADRTEGPPRRAKAYRDHGPDDLGRPFLGSYGEPGCDDAHFKDPQGMASDAKGRLYVCDWGNNRVMVFSPEGRVLGQWAVDQPEQIAVHPTTGAIYVLSRDHAADRGKARNVLRKFSAFAAEAPKEVASLQDYFTVMALDPNASPARLWLATAKERLLPVIDDGQALTPGDSVTNWNGVVNPSVMVGDPDRNRVVYRQGGTRAIDLTTGKVTELIKDDHNTDLGIDAQGNLYMMEGYGSEVMLRFDSTGKPLPWNGSDSNRMKVGPLVSVAPAGFCLAMNGDVYLYRSNRWIGGVGNRVDVFGPDGKPKRLDLVVGTQGGDCGIGVDAAGNVYLGANLKPKDRPLPGQFVGKVPPSPWEYWRFEVQGPREVPWCYPYVNPYLHQMGAVFKFSPAGGQIYGFAEPYPAENGKPKPDPAAPPQASIANAPPGASTYWSGYLRKEGRVAGALWRYAGVGPIPTDFGWGDPGCVCYKSRLSVDPYGRVFAPNVFQFGVEMLDTNGNRITRIGTYGNTDDGLAAPAGVKRTGPELAFAWPTCASAAGEKVFISDSANCRITVVRFGWQAEATVAP